jgi:hypothetical protein
MAYMAQDPRIREHKDIGSIYPGYGSDPFRALTTSLVENIVGDKPNLAKLDYGRIKQELSRRGKIGKHIRYVERQLNGLATKYKGRGNTDKARIVKSYAKMLPKPSDVEKRTMRKGHFTNTPDDSPLEKLL